MVTPYKDRVLARVILESLIQNGKVDIEEAQLFNKIINDIVDNYNHEIKELNESLMADALEYQRYQMQIEEAMRAQAMNSQYTQPIEEMSAPQPVPQPTQLEENFDTLNIVKKIL